MQTQMYVEPTTISWQTNASVLALGCVCVGVRNVIVKYAEIYMQVRAAYTHQHSPPQVQTICCCGSNYIFINI